MKKIIAILIICFFLFPFIAYADDNALAKNIGLLVIQISTLQEVIITLEKENELLKQKLLQATKKVETNGLD
jgi:hypothetical protein